MNYKILSNKYLKDIVKDFVNDCNQLEPFANKQITFTGLEKRKEKAGSFIIKLAISNHFDFSNTDFNLTLELARLINSNFKGNDFDNWAIQIDEVTNYNFDWINVRAKKILAKREFNEALPKDRKLYSPPTQKRSWRLLDLNTHHQVKIGLLGDLFHHYLALDCVEFSDVFEVTALYKKTDLDISEPLEWRLGQAILNYDDVNIVLTDGYKGIEGLLQATFNLSKTDWQVLTN